MSRLNSSRMRFQVAPVVVSMMRISSSAGQHKMTCADAFLEPVIDRAQVDDLLHVSPSSLNLQQLLVAEGDVLSRQFRVGAAQQVLALL
ncbi:hypothetical protein ACIBQ1_20250 [Nonomuraea sp. NPDC050153]|uniref:hypothetical protein n=1 Tax=Nonomuraea sp. NPDC050153 TaxID=3364359 RepID=UPI00379E08A3